MGRRRHTLDRSGGNQIDGERDRRLGGVRCRHDADAAHLDFAGDRLRRCSEQPAVTRRQGNLIVRHQDRAAIDEAKRKVRFSAARRTAQKHAGAGKRNAGGVDQCHDRYPKRSFRRQANGEARAVHPPIRATPVGGGDGAAVGLDDLA